MNKKKVILYTGVVVLMILTIWLILSISSRHRKQNTPNPASPTSETGPIGLQNTESLSNILLQKQFNALLYTLADFIQKKVDSSTPSASVVGSPAINIDGTITFKVLLNTPKKQSFTVNVDRSVFDRLTVSVPEYQYTETISVY